MPSVQLSPDVQASAERYRTLLELNNTIITHLTRETLWHAVSEILRRVVPMNGAAITIYNPKTDTYRYLVMESPVSSDHFRAGMEFKRESSMSAWVFDNKRPVMRQDIEAEQQYANDQLLLKAGIRSDCIVPLIVEGKIIGTLNVGSTEKNQYSESDLELLQEMANQVALAIVNMLSYEEIAALNARVERSAERYRTLLEINNAMITNLTHEDLLRAVSMILRRIVPLDGAVITLYNPKTETFRYYATETSLSTEYFRTGLEVHRNESMVAEIFDNQRGLIRSDLAREQRFPNERRLVELGIASYCIVPLIVGGKSIGTLGVGSTKRDQYREEDMELLQEVANQVALAVTNMKSYEEVAGLKARLEQENVYLQEEIRSDHNFEEITGNSEALMAVLHKVEQVAPTDSTTLIYGETGTGKELIARAIHDRSSRKNRPLVKVNCSAISAGLVESELFGHVKGAFTGALDRHVGRFELADGGTIFLDEIGELPLATQVKLLRVLQEREFEPVGSNRPIRVDVRVIAATNRNLEESVAKGDFRSDFFYRLNVFPIELPPLRERASDIAQLAMFFVDRFSRKFGKATQGISRSTLDRLLKYSWPGNVRELQNVIERAVILSRTPVLELAPDLLPSLAGVSAGPLAPEGDLGDPRRGESGDSSSTLEEVERTHLDTVLTKTKGVVEGPRGAAIILGLHPNTLRHRMKKLGLKGSTYRRL